MRRNIDKRTLTGCLAALSCETLFGFSYIFTKNVSDKASGLALLGWRYAVAALVMALLTICGFVKINLKGKSLKPLLKIAVISPVIYFLAETAGIRYTSASESGVFLASIPIFSLILSAKLLHRKPEKKQICGIAVTLTGVVVTTLAVQTSVSLSAKGYAMLFLAVLSYSLYSVLVEKAAGYTEMEITFVMLMTGAAVFSLLALAEAALHGTVPELIRLPFSDSEFLTAVVYQGAACSLLAFFLSNAAIARIGVNRLSSFLGVSTVVSILSSVFLLGETFTKGQILGTVLIVTGVYTANSSIANKKDCEGQARDI